MSFKNKKINPPPTYMGKWNIKSKIDDDAPMMDIGRIAVAVIYNKEQDIKILYMTEIKKTLVRTAINYDWLGHVRRSISAS